MQVEPQSSEIQVDHLDRMSYSSIHTIGLRCGRSVRQSVLVDVARIHTLSVVTGSTMERRRRDGVELEKACRQQGLNGSNRPAAVRAYAPFQSQWKRNWLIVITYVFRCISIRMYEGRDIHVYEGGTQNLPRSVYYVDGGRYGFSSVIMEHTVYTVKLPHSARRHPTGQRAKPPNLSSRSTQRTSTLCHWYLLFVFI